MTTTRSGENGGGERELQRPLLESRLMVAVVTGNRNDVKTYCKGDAINMQSGWNNSTPLMVAVSLPNRKDIVRMLINKGAKVNLKNKLGNTAIMIAAETGHFEYVKLMIENKSTNADLKEKNVYEQTALHLAIEAYDDRIEAKHPDKKGRIWFPARIEKENEDGSYHVNYEDETLEPQTALKSHLVRSRRKNLHFLQKGYTVEMKLPDGLEWQKGRIERDNGDNTFDVKFDNGEEHKRVKENDIHSLEKTLWLHRCFDIFVYLAQKDPSLLTQRNIYQKEAMLVASEFGKLKVVEWLINNCKTSHQNIEELVNRRREDKNSALMYALSGTSPDHTKIVKLLLDNGADYKSVNGVNLSTLFWAVDGGNIESTKALIHRAQRDWDGDTLYDMKAPVQNTHRTALMQAVAHGRYEICEALLMGMRKVGPDGRESPKEFRKRMNRMWMVDTEDGLDTPGCMNALQIALKHGHVKIATDLFMIIKDCKGREYSMLFCKTNDVFRDRGVLLKMAFEMANKETIYNLMSYAVRYDFHFDLFITLIPLFPSPLAVLTDALPRFFNLFSTDARGCDQNILHRMVLLYTAVKNAMESNPLEETDLTVYMERLDTMISTICTNDTLADVKKLHDVLCYPSKRNMNMEEFKDEIVNLVHSFRYGPLDHCVDNHVLSVFGNGRITTFVNNLFGSYLRKRTDDEMEVPRFLGSYHSYFSTNINVLKMDEKKYHWSIQSENLRNLESSLIYLRYNPSMMFYLEGLCKLFYLIILIILVLRFGNDINGRNFMNMRIARLFAVFTACTVIYEYGELCGNQFRILPRMDSIKEYFQDNWNKIDGAGLSCVIAAYGFLVHCVLIPESQRDGVEFKRSEDTGKFLLSVSCIFFSSGILRSMYWYEDLGKLTIITFGISGNIASWFVLSAMSSVGFCVYYLAMHGDLENFDSTFQAIVTIFDHILMNFDAPTDTFGVGTPFREYAVVVNLMFLVFFGVVLLNLIIARMGSVYEDLEAKSFQEFQYQRADLVNQYSLIEERSPCCMLPAPFNFIPVLFSFLDILYIGNMTEETHIDDDSNSEDEFYDESGKGSRQKDPTPFICFSGTAANITIGMVMSFIGPNVELFKYLFNLLQDESLFQRSKEVMYFVFLWPLHYIPFLFALLYECMFVKSEIKHVPDDKDKQEYKYIVHFPTDRQYKEVPNLDDPNAKGPWMSIKIIRAECHQATYHSNPIVQIRLDDMQVETNESTFGGKNPIYTDQEFFFPLGDVNMMRDGVFKIVVLDRDSTKVDKVLGEFADDGNPVMDDGILELHGWECFKRSGIIRQWLADGRFEGSIPLENAMGSVNVVIKTDFMTHLQVYNKDDEDFQSGSKLWQTLQSGSDNTDSLRRQSSKHGNFIGTKFNQIGSLISGNINELDAPWLRKDEPFKKKSFPSYFQLSYPFRWLEEDLERYSMSLMHSTKNESLNFNWGDLLNEASSEGIEALFDNLDSNEDSDGKITLEELKKGLLQKQCPVFTFFVGEPELFTENETKDMMIQAFGRDKGDVGDLTIEILNTAGPYPRMKELFTKFDRDGDKGISFEELRAGLLGGNIIKEDDHQDSLSTKLDNIESMLSRLGSSSNASPAPFVENSSHSEAAELKTKLRKTEEKLKQLTEGFSRTDNVEVEELRSRVAELEGHRDDNDNIIEELHMVVEHLEEELNSSQKENERLLQEIEELRARVDIRAHGALPDFFNRQG